MKDKGETLKQLEELLDRVPGVREAGRGSRDFRRWRARSDVVVRNAFGESSSQLSTFKSIVFADKIDLPHESSDDTERGIRDTYFRDGLEAAELKLEAMIMEVRDFWQSDDPEKSAARTDVLETSNRNVFVAHGHDEAATQQLARFLERLELVPVILREEVSGGRTVIEKFDKYAAVSYAIALLTADDVGSSRHESAVRPRARQNVILELGYFIGRLGRNRVCYLTKGAPEIPTDLAGVVYVPMDSGQWQGTLVGELKDAGFEVDANKVF